MSETTENLEDAIRLRMGLPRKATAPQQSDDRSFDQKMREVQELPQQHYQDADEAEVPLPELEDQIRRRFHLKPKE
ncbi:MAG: hypothetical protein ABSF82_05530 [Candidatus Bathyarchaeia archaeon]|jgi:hypothetical protein